jgi:hypothetical protein
MSTLEILLIALGLAIFVPAIVSVILVGYSKLLDRASERKSMRVAMPLVVGILFISTSIAEAVFSDGASSRIALNAALGLTWTGLAVWNKWFDKSA